MSYENIGIGRWLLLIILYVVDIVIFKLSYFFFFNKMLIMLELKKNCLVIYIYDVQEVLLKIGMMISVYCISRSLIINSKDKKMKYIKI